MNTTTQHAQLSRRTFVTAAAAGAAVAGIATGADIALADETAADGIVQVAESPIMENFAQGSPSSISTPALTMA